MIGHLQIDTRLNMTNVKKIQKTFPLVVYFRSENERKKAIHETDFI